MEALGTDGAPGGQGSEKNLLGQQEPGGGISRGWPPRETSERGSQTWH